MTLNHLQKNVSSDLTVPKEWNKLRLRMIYKRRPRDFGEISVHQTLKFRDSILELLGDKEVYLWSGPISEDKNVLDVRLSSYSIS